MKKISLVAIMLMVVLSFTNLLEFNISSISIFVGVAFFFINNALEKHPMKGSGLDITAISTDLKNNKIWIWILLPLIMDAICVIISILFIPEYIEYETTRAGAFVPIELSISSLFQFLIFALGEEIAWRAFFQKQLCKTFTYMPVILISSLLFTLGHFEMGNIVVVTYGLLFTFINSILYGIIFHKTQNAWISTISHFTANIFEVALFILLC